MALTQLNIIIILLLAGKREIYTIWNVQQTFLQNLLVYFREIRNIDARTTNLHTKIVIHK